MNDNILKKYSSILFENLEELLSLMKHDGFSMFESVKFLRRELGISLKEADRLVMNSVTWKDERYSTSKLRNDFFESIQEEINS